MIKVEFDDLEAPEAWSVESLNARLELLESGEVLVIDDLPNEIYHQSNGVSCSKIKKFIECPYMYWAHFIEKSVPYEHKSYFDFGSAGHTAILEPWKFDDEYAKQPEDMVRQGREWEYFQERHNGKTILTHKQWELLPELVKAVRGWRYSDLLTKNGKAETSYYKRDEETGLIIKCRTDYEVGGFISDLKTSDTVDPKYMISKFKKLGYHVQDAMYSDIVKPKGFVFVAVSSSQPIMVTAPVEFSRQLKRLGYLKYRKALRGIKECMESGVWPMYTDQKVTIEPNQYDLAELETLEGEL